MDNEDDIELLEARHRRRPRVDYSDSDPAEPRPESQTQATPSHKYIFEEVLNTSCPKKLSKNDTDEETNATSKLAPTDEIMTDTMTQPAEKNRLKLPPLRQILSASEHTSDSEGNIDRPDYDEYNWCEGFVAWWDDRTGKGMVIDYRHSLEHKIELRDIQLSNYGALVPGSMVEYEYYDNGSSRGISKIWVVSGCEYVL